MDTKVTRAAAGGLALLVFTLGVPLSPVVAQEEGEIVWQAWESKDVAALGDDNSGSTFAASEEVLSPAGSPTVQVTPSGTSEETKLAFPVGGADLQDWATHAQVELEVFLPEDAALHPNQFFMGMADVTGEFAWIGGIFSETQAQPGWNRIVFVPDAAMRQPDPDASYNLFLSFFYADENENKTPLTDPLYLGSFYLAGAEAGAVADSTAEAEATVDSAVEPVTWQAWEAKNPGMLGDDNTGTDFAQSQDVLSPSGSPALQIIPTGSAEETKLSFPVSGTNLQDWITHGQVELEIHQPPENAITVNRIFMGLADITGEWTWVGGNFGELQDKADWARIVFVLDPLMQEINPNGTYIVYLSFFNVDEDENKTPLAEPFYLGSVTLQAAPEAESTPTPPEEADMGTETSTDAVYQREVDLLLSLDDTGLLDAVAHETFDFFWYEANPENGLIKDRSTPDSASSIAAVGFGLAAIPVAVDRGWITEAQGYERALMTLKTFAEGGVMGEHGFFFHFVDMQTGERVWSSEVSSIDTTLFIAGALTAGAYFEGTEVETLAAQLYEQIDWQWMAASGIMPSMGWKPDIGFLSATWDHFDESLLLYVLAIGSPTHPIPVEAWDRWKRPVNTQGEFIYLPAEPLFVYQYPLAWLDLRDKEDAYANYFNNTLRACERNREFSFDNADTFATYGDGVWGISASDGPRGYRAYGANGGNHDGTVAPYASIACLPFTPEAAVESMRAMLEQYGSRVWREYGFVSAINAEEDWYSTEHIGIDQGDMLLMIANYQDGFVWDLFMQNEPVQNALAQMGFVEQASDYAVTPAYLEQGR